MPVLEWVVDKLLAGLIIAAAASLIAPWALERHRGRRDSLFRLSDHLASRTERLFTLCVEYWATPYNEQDTAREAQIQHVLSEISAAVRLLQPQIFSDAGNHGTYRFAMLSDAATGGDFKGGKRRAADPARIAMVAHEIQAMSRFVLARRKSWLDKWHPW